MRSVSKPRLHLLLAVNGASYVSVAILLSANEALCSLVG